MLALNVEADFGEYVFIITFSIRNNSNMRENIYSSAYYMVNFCHTINNLEFRISIDHYAAYDDMQSLKNSHKYWNKINVTAYAYKYLIFFRSFPFRI